jgi:hypothetical protein
MEMLRRGKKGQIFDDDCSFFFLLASNKRQREKEQAEPHPKKKSQRGENKVKGCRAEQSRAEARRRVRWSWRCWRGRRGERRQEDGICRARMKYGVLTEQAPRYLGW